MDSIQNAHYSNEMDHSDSEDSNFEDEDELTKILPPQGKLLVPLAAVLKS